MKKTAKTIEKPFISPEPLSKLLPAERAAIRILADNPDLKDHQIGNKLKALGLTKDSGYVNKRLKRSELLALSLSKIRQHNTEFLAKRIVPRALEIQERVLRNKKIPDKDKFSWAKLALDKEFGSEDKRPPKPPVINVKAAQIFMQKVGDKPLNSAMDQVIDVTPNNKEGDQ